jgi:hypothetical protein
VTPPASAPMMMCGGDPGDQIAGAPPLPKHDGGEIAHHDRVEAEAREVAEVGAAIRADGGAREPDEPHGEAAAKKYAGIEFAALACRHGLCEIGIAEKQQGRQSSRQWNA